MGLFGSKKKPDIGAIYKDPPQRQIDQAAYDRYKQGYNYLTNTYENRANGNDIFDYIKYLFEPQKTALLQDYGLTGDPNDVYSNQSGTLPKTLASLNARGLLDSGTSGVVEGQIRSNANNKLAELFGNAKQLQRQDIDNALDALHTLYPENFQIADIPYELAYNNAINSYNVGVQRNAAQQAYEGSQGPKTFFGQVAPMLGQVAGSAIGNYFAPGVGGPIGGQIGGSLGGVVGGQSAGYNYKPSSSSFNLGNIFGSSNSRNKSSSVSTSTPGVGNFFNDNYGVNPNPYQPLSSSGNYFQARYGVN